LVGPIQSIQVGMGEPVLILAFVVIVIGGLGSIKGALLGALLVGLIDTMGRAYAPGIAGLWFDPAQARGVGAAVASILVYLLMALVLIFKPKGLFPAHG
jgi:branched-chain amino acid transport system permease protein